MAGQGKKKMTGVDEAGNKGGPGRPPLSEEEKKKKKEEKNQKSRESRLIKKSEFSRLLQEEKVFKAFCEEHGLTEEYQNYHEKCKKRTEESSKGTEEQTREFNEEVDKLGEVILDCGTDLLSEEELQLLIQYYPEDQAAAVEENHEMLEGNLKAGPSNVDSNSGGEWQSSTTLITGGVTNSSGAGGCGGIGPILGSPPERAELKRRREEDLDEARRGKRPATADFPPCSTICDSQPIGFMADARRQTSSESATAHLFSTNKGLETGGAVHDKVVSSHAEVEKSRKFTDEPGTGSNDFAKLQYEKRQVKDSEKRKQEQEVLAAASIDANPKFKKVKKERDDLKKQVEKLQEVVSKLQGEVAKRDEPSGTTPPGDPNAASLAANSPLLQTANTGTNNVDQEDNIAHRENKAAEADKQFWLSLLMDSDLSELSSFHFD